MYLQAFLCCSLKCQFKPIAEEEVTQLQEFARSEGFADELQMWDLPYWRRRHRQHLFKYVVILINFPLSCMLGISTLLCSLISF